MIVAREAGTASPAAVAEGACAAAAARSYAWIMGVPVIRADVCRRLQQLFSTWAAASALGWGREETAWRLASVAAALPNFDLQRAGVDPLLLLAGHVVLKGARAKPSCPGSQC